MSADPVRRLAWEALAAVGRGEALDAVLDGALARVGDPRDRALLARMVKGTLRGQGRYDLFIRRFSSSKRFPQPPLAAALRLALHQMLDCDAVPAHAAVNASVDLARLAAGRRAAPFANAVLRASLRHLDAAGGDREKALAELLPDRVADPAGHLAGRRSLPRWLVARWLDRFGYDAVDAMGARLELPAPLTLHVLAPADPAAAAARLRGRGLDVRPGSLSARALVLGEGPSRPELAALLGDEPELIVQDEAVQAATDWLAAGAGGRLLDLCAAPGGKTLHLRAAWPDPDGVVAMDRDASRMALVAASAARTGASALPLVVADGMLPPFRPGTFDAVLLDGPCTGTGVLRHHPEGRWRLSPAAVVRSADRLLKLARVAADLLAPGGRLLYCTCSLEPEENSGVVEALLAERPDLSPDPPSPGGEAVRWWLPHREGADGFFAARLVRKEDR